MEGVPSSIKYDEIVEELKKVDEDSVLGVHDLRVWSVTSDRSALSVHLAVKSSCKKEKVIQEATKMLRNKFQISMTTIQTETYNLPIMDGCDQCKPLE